MGPGMELAMIEYQRVNEAHFRPWNPPPTGDEYSQERWITQCAQSAADFDAGRGYRFIVFAKEAPNLPIGVANYSQVSRGPFQACFLGYQIDREYQGRGIMQEALMRGNRFIFEKAQLHRIHANYIPANIRSGRLLARLGFVIEGYAKDYLFINGAWQDHVLTSLTNHAMHAPPLPIVIPGTTAWTSTGLPQAKLPY